MARTITADLCEISSDLFELVRAADIFTVVNYEIASV